MRKKLLLLAGGLCFTLGVASLQAQETQWSENLQTYVFDDEEQGNWFGVSITGISDNGKYAVGYDDTFKNVAVIWDLDTRTFKQITGSLDEEAKVYDVSDNGTVVGVFKDETVNTDYGHPFVPGYWKDGVWTALPLAEGLPIKGKDGNGYANTISPDGTIITGYVLDWFYSEEKEKDLALCRPAIWINKVLQPGFENLPKREEFGQGLWTFHASADGKVLGGKFENPNGSRYPAVWVNGELTRLYEEIKDNGYFFSASVGAVSPSGKYVVGYFAPEGGSSVLIPFVYDTETKEKEEPASPWGLISAVTDEGTIYGSSGYLGEALIRTKNYNGSLTSYLVEKYSIDPENLEFSPSNVRAASADGRVIGGFYVADAGFTAGMLPFIIVMDRPLSVQTTKSTPTLHMSGREISATDAERIELYDVSGCKLNSVVGNQISVSGLNGVIIAKAYFSNGETDRAKFVVR